jgi:hypothetical protein
MATFRGTLIGGVLQPHTRLGNGLELGTSVAFHAKAKTRESTNSTKPQSSARAVEMTNVVASEHPSIRPNTRSQKARETSMVVGRQPKTQNQLSRREAELDRREQKLLLLQQQLLQSVTLPRRKSTVRKRYIPHQMPQPLVQRDDRAPYAQPEEKLANTDPMRSEIEVRERELYHKEEVLRWKRKAFVLEQKLASARAADLAEPPETDTMATLPLAPENDSVTEPSDDYPSDPGSKDGQDDPFADIHAQSTPLQRGARRQTRIKLPKRR